jgi:adenylosuccinate synthase
VAYDVNGTRHDEVPMTQTEFHHAVPVYEYLDGWWEDISSARQFEDLPRNAQAYVRAVEDMIGTRVGDRGGPAPRPDAPDPAPDLTPWPGCGPVTLTGRETLIAAVPPL